MTVALRFEDCPVVELRRYTLHPDAVPDLLRVFERYLIEPQEDDGMAVGGTFSDEDDPCCFTWLRGFADHGARLRSLEAFYGGHVWARFRDAANATMVDSDDVLLLRPTQPAHLPAAAVQRGGPDDRPRRERGLLGTCGPATDDASLEDWLATIGQPALEDVQGVRVATWRTDPTRNEFRKLPVRDERAIAWLAMFPDGDRRDSAAARLVAADVGLELDRRAGWRRTARLAPTVRSAHPATEPARARDGVQRVPQ